MSDKSADFLPGMWENADLIGGATDCVVEPEPTAFCIDYGHHGRERCVFCGRPRPPAADGGEGTLG